MPRARSSSGSRGRHPPSPPSSARSIRPSTEGDCVHFFDEASLWVGDAFLNFLSLLWRLGAHRSILASLDARRAMVHDELAEARRLKSEAQKLLAHYQKKQREAEMETAQAERQAVADVRAAAADAAVRASETILSETVKGKTADDLLASAIRDV